MVRFAPVSNHDYDQIREMDRIANAARLTHPKISSPMCPVSITTEY